MTDSVAEWASLPCGALSLDGESERHLTEASLMQRMASISVANKTDSHRLNGIVIRSSAGSRVQPHEVLVSIGGGLDGDRWAEGKANPSNQISMMNVDIAHAMANGQSVALFGDNLFTDLDLSESALPVGAQIQVGEVQLMVSREPHVPCDRFKKRFGSAAFSYAAKHPRIRGIYLTVVRGGVIRKGDAVTVLD